MSTLQKTRSIYPESDDVKLLLQNRLETPDSSSRPKSQNKITTKKSTDLKADNNSNVQNVTTTQKYIYSQNGDDRSTTGSTLSNTVSNKNKSDPNPKATITPKKTKTVKKVPITVKHNPNYIRHEDEEEPFCCEGLECCSHMDQGPFSFRSFVCLSAILALIGNVSDYVDGYWYSSGFWKFVSQYLWVYLTFFIILEGMPFQIQMFKLHRFVLSLAPNLRTTWGRGFFYFISGAIQVALLTDWNLFGGALMMVVGTLSVMLGMRASKCFGKICECIESKDQLRAYFERFDANRDRYLDPREFADFVLAFDADFSYNDAVAIFSSIDEDNDRLITAEDLQKWWAMYSKAKDKSKLVMV